MKRPALLAFAGLLAACSSEKLTVSVDLVALTPKDLTIEVTTSPGAHVSLEYGGLASGPVADARGKARIVLPREELAHRDGEELSVYADVSTTFRHGFGQGHLRMPVRVAKLGGIPDKGPLYVSYLDGAEAKGTAEKSVVITDAREPDMAGKPRPSFYRTVYWTPTDPRFTFFFAAPAGSKVDIGGTAVDVANGLAKAEIPSDTLALSVEMATLSAKKPTLSLPVSVTKDGQTQAHTVALIASSWHDKSWWLAARIDGVAGGKGFPAGATVDALLLRTPDDEVVHLGAPGRAAQARWVALERPTPRENDSLGHRCPVHSYEDLDVDVLDARTGRKLASRHFKAPDARCPEIYYRGQPRGIARPDDETIAAWLQTGMAGPWK
jgi:hypothetical protein